MIMARERLGFRGMVNRGGRGFGRNVILLLVGYGLALGAKAYAEAVSVYLAFAIDRMADAGSTIATWAHSGFIRFTFARQAIPMTWDFAECNFLSDSTGNFGGAGGGAIQHL